MVQRNMGNIIIPIVHCMIRNGNYIEMANILNSQNWHFVIHNFITFQTLTK